METADPSAWRKCSSCKKPISFSAKFWLCSVSTCNQRRTNYAFCTVECWDSHVPRMNHKECWAVEKRAPSSQVEADRMSKSTKSKEEDSSSPTAKTALGGSGNASKTVIRRPGGAGSGGST